MNREILFRGKRVDNGEWVYGGYMKNKNGIYITDTEHYHLNASYKNYLVIPETIGQYTGLTDKNGNKVFEGDLVICSWIPALKWKVIFIDGSFYLKNSDNRHISFAEVIERIKGNIQGNIEVIGNIFDKEVEE